MPLEDSPVLERLSIPVQIPAPDTFVLGTSLLGSGDALGTGTGPGFLTLNLLDSAVQSVTVDRGVEPNYLQPKPMVGTMVISLKNPAYIPSMGNKLQLIYNNTDAPPGGQYMFTGRVSNIYKRIDPVSKESLVNITVLDRVAEIVNTPRFGSIVPGPLLVEHTRERMERLISGLVDSQVVGRTNGPDISMTSVSIVTPYKAREAWTVTGLIDYIPGTYPRWDFDLDSSMSAEITGLIPGNYYQFAISAYRERPAETRLFLDNREIDFSTVTGFIPETDKVKIRIESRGIVEIATMQRYQRNTSYPADLHTSTVHESTLANHLDQIVAGTTEWGWYIDAKGSIIANAKARETGTSIRPGLQNMWIQSPLISNNVDYVEVLSDVEIAESFDDLVNEINFESHQIQWDDDGVRAARDVSILGLKQETSINRYGRRVETLETQIGDAKYAYQTAEMLLTRTAPIERITDLVLSGQQTRPAGPGLAAAVARAGPFDHIRSAINDLNYGTMLVANVKHVITPTRWLCHVTTLPQG